MRFRFGKVLAWGLLVSLMITGCGSSQPGAAKSPAPQQYAGEQQRTIKALAPERVADLLEGKGAGYALAGELNHYPGPTHVLQLAAELQLTPSQEARVRDLMGSMNAAARELGEELVALEAQLDTAFQRETITSAALSQFTAEIAAVEGRLRSTHLASHLTMKTILTPEQIKRYDELRGYTPSAEGAPTGAPHGH